MNNENNGFQELLPLRGELINYAYRILGCRSRAEDIVQDAFLKIMPKDNALVLTSSGAGLGYLYRTVRNLALDYTRRATMEKRHQTKENITWIEPAQEQNPENTCSQRDDILIVTEVLSKMSENERTAIEMHRFDGYSLAEIAQHLDVSSTTVHRLIKNGVVLMTKALSEQNKNIKN